MATINSFVSVHVTKNKRDFLFLMPSGTSYQDCHEAFVEGAEKIQRLAKEAVERQALEKKEAASKEEPKKEEPVEVK